MSARFKTIRRIEFRDTDAAGIAHFSVFFTMMEEAEHELLRHVGLSVHMNDGEQTISWPRVSASCEFRGPAAFEDELEIDVQIARLGEKSVTYEFRFSHENRLVAEGRMTSVCCQLEPGNPPRSIPIPTPIAAKLRGFLKD